MIARVVPARVMESPNALRITELVFPGSPTQAPKRIITKLGFPRSPTQKPKQIIAKLVFPGSPTQQPEQIITKLGFPGSDAEGVPSKRGLG